VWIDQSNRDGCTILAPVGEFNLATVASLRQALLKGLSERPLWGVHHPRKGGKVVWCVLER
jgi:hypothetical protein